MNTFLAVGDETGRLIQSTAGSGTPLDTVESWRQSRCTTDNFRLALDLPICAARLVQIYTDRYGVIRGDKRPRSLGQNFPECWKEAQPVFGKSHDSALAGDTAFLETQHTLQTLRHRGLCPRPEVDSSRLMSTAAKRKGTKTDG